MNDADDATQGPDTRQDEFRYGPVEVYLIGFSGERPGREVVDAILDLIESGSVRLLDLLFVSRSSAGELTVLELEEIVDKYGLEGLEIIELGLAGEDDINDLAAAIEPETSAVVLVVEHVWARKFAETLFRAGGRVLQTERIPAPVVNEVVAAVTA